MTQAELERAVADVTGETVTEIKQRGFGIADPVVVTFDPEPLGTGPHVVDWDGLDAERCVVFPR